MPVDSEVRVLSPRDPSDRQRFEELCIAHYGRIMAYALRRVGSLEDASDIAAEVFAIAWRRIKDVPAGDRALPWLYGTARKVVANHHRGRRRQRRLEAKLEGVVPPTGRQSRPESAVEQVDMERVADAFQALRERDREVLRLVGWEGLPRDELATALGCSRATARLRLHRARRRFLAALEDHAVDVSRWLPSHRKSDQNDGMPQTTEETT